MFVTFLVALSIRETLLENADSLPELVTYVVPSGMTATPKGEVPTDNVETSFVVVSIKETVLSPEFVTYT